MGSLRWLSTCEFSCASSVSDSFCRVDTALTETVCEFLATFTMWSESWNAHLSTRARKRSSAQNATTFARYASERQIFSQWCTGDSNWVCSGSILQLRQWAGTGPSARRVAVGTRAWSRSKGSRDPAGQIEFFLPVSLPQTLNWLYSYRQLTVRIVVSAIAVFWLVDDVMPSRLQIVHWPNYKLNRFANSNRDTGIEFRWQHLFRCHELSLPLNRVCTGQSSDSECARDQWQCVAVTAQVNLSFSFVYCISKHLIYCLL